MQIEHLKLERESATIEPPSPIISQLRNIEDDVDVTASLINNLETKVDVVIDPETFAKKLEPSKAELKTEKCQLEAQLEDIEERLKASNMRLLALLESIRL